MNDERKQFGVRTPSVEAGDYPTGEENREIGSGSPDGFSVSLGELDQQQRDAILATIPGGIDNVQEIYPLSPLQEGMLFHHVLSERSDSYILSTLFELRSPAQIGVLAEAIQKVINRHNALRTAVLWEGLSRALQVVYRQASLSVDEITLNSSGDAIEQMKERMRPGHRKLQLQRAPLVRLEVAQDRERMRWYAVLYVHHIVCDHASLMLAANEIMACLQRREHELPTAVPFREHVIEALSTVRLGEEDGFFRHKLGDVTEPTAPFGLLNVHGAASQLEEAREALDPALAQEIRLQARKTGVSVARLFHVAWGLVIARTSGRDDVVFGTVLQSRRQRSSDAAYMLGMSVNTLPLRLPLGNATTIEMVERTHRELSDLLQFEQVPLTRAQGQSGVAAGSPLFTAVLNYRRSPPQSQFEGVSVAGIRLLERGEASTNYPVGLIVDDLGEGFALTAQTDRSIDPCRLIGYLRTALHSLVQALAQAPQTRALTLSILPEDERRQVIEQHNATQTPYPREQLLHRLFEEQMERTPAAIAVVHEEQSLTYVQLNRRANQLARYLCAGGVRPNELVGLCTERSVEMLVGVLGIWKAGGAYVPLDPQYPSERLGYMVQDAAPKVLLTQRRLFGCLPHADVEVIALDEWEEIGEQEEGNLELGASGESPDQLAYVIYTSGSTGLPKGVMIEHRSVLNLWQGLETIYGGAGCGRVALNASLNFDASVQQFVQLLSGRTLYVLDEQRRRDAERLLSFVADHGIQGIDCTPSQLKLWISAGLLQRAGPLRVVLVGGEPIDTELWGELSQCAEIEFYNVYGPTECTVDATMARLRGDRTAPHIGRPMPNRRVFILDGQGDPTPIGVAGEIHIGGAGVARGYLNRPELTQQRFVRDPFTGDGRGRMYRTGDLGRWRADGAIEYLGRNDQQVKMRGFRIELGEIEAQLLRHEWVQECVVMVREDVPGEKRLVAYVVCAGGDVRRSAEVLRTHLTMTLPEYMVPGAFVQLDRLPLTPNGKLDRRALPIPNLGAYATQQYEAPKGDAEEILAEIWQSVLRVERVGRQDNFFELGGHSLLILQLMELLRKVGLSADLQQVFDHPTLADLAKVLTRGDGEQCAIPPNLIPPDCTKIEPEMLPLAELEPEHIERIVRLVPGGAANVQDIYPLVPLQEGILFHHLFDERRGETYVLSVLLSVSSRERADELIAALQAAIDRHDVLRTAVQWEGLPRPMQVVYRRARLPVEEVELDKDRDPMPQVRDWLKSDQQRLDVRKSPLLRLQIAADPQSQQYYALLQIHHLVMDHASLAAVIAEVVAHLGGDRQQLPVTVPYRNHVAQSLDYARKHDVDAFFRDKLADVFEPTAPFGILDVHADGTQVEEARDEIEHELARRVRVQARSLGVTAAALFHAAWGLVVAHTSARDDVVFGSLLLGRLQSSAGAQQILGVFINTLPLRLRLRGVAARALVEQTQRELMELLNHEQASLAVAQRCSGIVGSAPLFTALLNYRHSVASPQAEWSGAHGIGMLATQERTNYPITLSVDDLGAGFALTASTDRRIDPQRVIGYLHTAMRSLVEALDEAPQTLALSLPILPQSERRHVTEIVNATQAPYSLEKLIHQLFEEQVERTPKAVALVYEGERLSYDELNGRSNQLARYLRERGVGPDALVGICVERSIEMLVGLLGILKAGGAYLPLDPDYPAERLAYMVADSAPRVLLTQRRLRERIPAISAEILELDGQWAQFALHEMSNLDDHELRFSSRQLAYMIYTSGSTGRPKGAMNEHRALINRLQWMQSAYQLDPMDRVLQKTPFSFDVSAWEFFWPLLNGAQLVIARPRGHQDPEYLRELIQAEHVTTLHFVPSMLQIFVNQLETGQCPSLRHVVCSGEELPASLQRTFFERLPQAQLSNLYGPTEAAIDVTYWECRPEDQDVRVPIGRPIWNTQMYVLDEWGQPVPIGVTGELYIGGVGVGRGYGNRAELTAQRFVPDSFSADPSARLYKTGDLGRWRADGAIEYLGRNDFQVKIRGLRIELGEIDARLAQHEAVKEAVVLAREDVPGDKRLVAYVVPQPGADVSVEELREHVSEALPEYMVPSAFVLLEQFPLSPNGKLDRQALPMPELGAYATREYEPPLGEIEEILAGVWQSLLKVERVGRQDNFFDMGGHSLLALQALVKINQVIRGSVRLTDIYQHPTIQALATRIERGATREEFVDLSHEAVLDPHVTALPYRPRTPAHHILLTGATGFVGRFLLAQLLEETNATIHCLVRARSAQEASLRVRDTLKAWHLWRDDFDSRIVAIQGDLSLPRLGMTASSYRNVCEDIDSIFHCGTSMNHLETYAMAKPANVDSARELLTIATSNRPKLVNYISSLSVFGLSGLENPRVVREHTPIDHEGHPVTSGYSASKWVGEKIFMLASERGVPCNIFRLGLVWADTQRGRYDERQHVYRLLKSCLLSGCGIEDYYHELNPTPVDYAVRSVTLLAGRHPAGGGVFHISSPGEQTEGWFERCNKVANTSLRILPFYNWIREIKRRHVEGQSLPVVPLIEYAFSMDEKAFYEHRLRIRSGMFRVDCELTYRELEASGIVAPVFNDDLLRVTIDAIRSGERLRLPRSRGHASVAV